MFREKLRTGLAPGWKSNWVSPARIIIFGFLALILLGTVLLMLPFTTRGWGGASFFGALFTATSATCVTGLVIYDTVSYWSEFGQMVILLVIQVGGMGGHHGRRHYHVLRKTNRSEAALGHAGIHLRPQVGGIVGMTSFILKTAIGTVGLSLGGTARFSALSRMILIFLMYFGRVGGLTMIYAVTVG